MIEKMLVLHSSAVSDSTWKKLKKNKLETICYKKDTYGFFIYCTEYENIPEDLKRCISYARELGCVWLCLDIDAETICYKKDTYGFFIYCTEYENIPEDLKRCISYARELGCVWLCLDIDAEAKIYVTYEDEFKGQYTEKEMLELYALVDKQEYPEYSCWITDMIRSGVFYEKV